MQTPLNEAQRQYLQVIRTKMLKVSVTMRETVAKLHEQANAAANPQPIQNCIPASVDLGERAQRVARVAERGINKGHLSPAEWKIMFDEMMSSDERVRMVHEMVHKWAGEPKKPE